VEHPFHTTPVTPGEAVVLPDQPRPRSALLIAADKADQGVALLCQGVLLVTGVALVGVLTANVIARYVLATGGFDWAEEVPEQVFPWFIMAGVALAVQRGGHIAVEWLLGRLGRDGNRIVLLAGHVLVICAYTFLCWKALEVADIVALERSPALGLPKTYGYWAIAAGCALLALSTVSVAIRLAVIGPEALPRPTPEEIPT
jgi:TRAP-type C4-dicarboxylate transport system permease small subunit